MTALATVFVEGRVDTHLMPEDIRKGLSSGSVAASASSAGKKTGAEFGSKFSTGVVETGRKGTSSLFAQAEKGAVASGLGIGRRAGQGIAHGLGEYAKLAGATVAGYFAAEKVKEFFTAAVDGAEALHKSEALTAQAIKSTGGVANVTTEDIDVLTKAIEAHSAASQLDIRSAETLALRFTAIRNEVGKGNDVYDQAVTMATNLSAATGRGLTPSMLVLGKALNAPTTGLSALTRVGIQFTDQQKAQIAAMVQAGDLLGAQELILDQLGKKYGGAAEAARTPIDALKQSFGDLEIEVGQKLLPVMNDGASLLVTLGTDAGVLAHLIGEVPAPLRDVALALLAFKAASSLGLLSGISRGFTEMRLQAMIAGETIQKTGLKMIGLKAGAAGLAVGLAEVSAHTTGVAHDLSSIGAATAAGAVFGPWGAAIGAATGLLSVFGGGAQDASVDVSGFTGTLDENTGAVTKASQAWAAQTAAKQIPILHAVGVSVDEYTKALLGNKPAQDAVNAAMDTLPAGLGDDVKKSLSDVNTQIVLNNISLAEQRRLWDENAVASHKFLPTAAQLAKVYAETGGAAGIAEGGIKGVTSATDDATAATKEFTLAQKAAQGLLSKAEAYTAFKQALADTAKLIHANTINLNQNTQKGRDNASQIQDLIGKIQDYAGNLHGLNKTDYLQAQVASISKLAPPWADTKAKADAYARSVLGLPQPKPTKPQFDDGAARAGISSYRAALDGLNGKIVKTYVDTVFIHSGVQSGDVLPHHAMGGLVRGMGTGTSDSVLERNSAGEFVAQAKIVQQQGVSAFQALNAGLATIVPKFNLGGMPAPSQSQTGAASWSPAPSQGGGDVVGELRAIRAALEQHGIRVKSFEGLGAHIEVGAQQLYDAERNWRR